MFENCNTLQELNEERVRLSQTMGNVPELNNAYNEKRIKILNSKSVARLNPIKVMPIKFETSMAIPYAGQTDKPGHIILTGRGFLV